MTRTRKWVSLALALSLLASAMAPTAALAIGGKTGKQIESTDPMDPPLIDQTGDPEPGTGGLQFFPADFSLWQQILLSALRIQMLPALSQRPAQTARAASSLRTRSSGGKK
jgi:hypothetical protein